jgi:hypothetical protein
VVWGEDLFKSHKKDYKTSHSKGRFFCGNERRCFMKIEQDVYTKDLNWQTKRFGMEDTYPSFSASKYEERMEEVGFDPRIIASQAEMQTRGFSMEEGVYYYTSR